MIDLAWISLAALVLVIVSELHDSRQSRVSFAGLAWVIGIYLAPFWGRNSRSARSWPVFPPTCS